LTWIAVSTRDGERAEQFLWKGDRLANKEQSADAALDLILQTVKGA
jgi:nicotinamide mononucleotide (NMN) deamidase PncC